MTTFLTGYVVVGLGIVAFVARMARRQKLLERSVTELQSQLVERFSTSSTNAATERKSEIAKPRAA